MSETVEIACQRCGEPIPFEVEDWATPPERAFCDEGCYEEHRSARPAEATATTA